MNNVTIKDYIDPRFELIDSEGNVLEAGTEINGGTVQKDDNGYLKTVRVNFQNKLENKEEVILYLKSKLKKLYLQGKTKNKIEVQWANQNELSGFSCDNEKFYSINKRI